MKLIHNKPQTEADFQELERIFTKGPGTREDYSSAFSDKPFGLLVRSIAKMDHEAVMRAFSSFTSDNTLNSRQIDFLNRIIAYIENNGYMENLSQLTKPPFDKPNSFIKLFDRPYQEKIIAVIKSIRENAERVTA